MEENLDNIVNSKNAETIGLVTGSVTALGSLFTASPYIIQNTLSMREFSQWWADNFCLKSESVCGSDASGLYFMGSLFVANPVISLAIGATCGYIAAKTYDYLTHNTKIR